MMFFEVNENTYLYIFLFFIILVVVFTFLKTRQPISKKESTKSSVHNDNDLSQTNEILESRIRKNLNEIAEVIRTSDEEDFKTQTEEDYFSRKLGKTIQIDDNIYKINAGYKKRAIHIISNDSEYVEELKRKLTLYASADSSHDRYKIRDSIIDDFIVKQIKCKEVEEWFQEQRIKIFKYLESEGKPEFQLTAIDKEKILKKNKIKETDYHPNWFDSLTFEPNSDYNNAQIFELFVKHKLSIIKYFYLMELGIRYYDENDKYFEDNLKYVEGGLAKRSKDIPPKVLLSELKISMLRNVKRELNISGQSKTKEQIINSIIEYNDYDRVLDSLEMDISNYIYFDFDFSVDKEYLEGLINYYKHYTTRLLDLYYSVIRS